MKKELYGEFIGTLIMVLFGCGSVAGAVLFGSYSSLFQVAFVWGIAVTLGILVARNYSPAHLNPAVSLGFYLLNKINLKRFLSYSMAQLLGAISAGFILFFIIEPEIADYELRNNILRGSKESIQSAMVFGEYFPNPGFKMIKEVPWVKAMFMEGLGTAILMFGIIKVTEKKEQLDNLVPLFIGFIVFLIICFVAPYTQAGLNPARDFGPRLVSSLVGWGSTVYSQEGLGFLTVYICGPFMGAALVSILFKSFK